MERKNINRGFKKLRVWQDAVSLYILACGIFVGFPFELKKVASNSIDAAHSISRNISEGYCRRSLKEYLNFLNIALASCGEFHSCCFHAYSVFPSSSLAMAALRSKSFQKDRSFSRQLLPNFWSKKGLSRANHL
jgi:four helix bundle protein